MASIDIVHHHGWTTINAPRGIYCTEMRALGPLTEASILARGAITLPYLKREVKKLCMGYLRMAK
eukprot:6181186-Pleurochrysis_carterae.AAC.5